MTCVVFGVCVNEVGGVVDVPPVRNVRTNYSSVKL